MLVSAINIMNMNFARSNAASNTFANNDAMYAMLGNTNFTSLHQISRAEQALQMANLRNALMYKAATACEQSTKDVLDKSIKNTFSYLA